MRTGPPSEPKKSSRKLIQLRFLALFALVVTCLVLRLIKLDQGFWYDEGFTGHLSRQDVWELIRFLVEDDIHPPFYFATVRAWAEFFPTDVGIRYLSVLTGVLSLPLLFSLGNKLFSHRVAWTAAVFFSVAPFHIQFSQAARQYSLYIFLTIAALWFLVTALQASRKISIWWICYSFMLTCILYTHGLAPLIVLGLAAFHLVLIWPLDRVRFFQWIGFHVLGLLFYLPWVPVQIAQAEIAGNSYPWLPPVSLYSVLRELRGYIYSPPLEILSHLSATNRRIFEALWMLPTLLLICAAILVPSPFSRKAVFGLLALLILPVVAVSLYGYFTHNIFVRRALAPVFVPVVLLVAAPMNLFPRSRWRYVIYFLVATSVTYSFASSAAYLKQRTGAEWRTAAAIITDNMGESDLVVVLPRDARFVFGFYFPCGRPDPGHCISLTTIDDLGSKERKLLNKAPRIWLVRDRVVDASRTRKTLEWFHVRSTISRDTLLQNVQLLLLEPKSMSGGEEAPSKGGG